MPKGDAEKKIWNPSSVTKAQKGLSSLDSTPVGLINSPSSLRSLPLTCCDSWRAAHASLSHFDGQVSRPPVLTLEYCSASPAFLVHTNSCLSLSRCSSLLVSFTNLHICTSFSCYFSLISEFLLFTFVLRFFTCCFFTPFFEFLIGSFSSHEPPFS